MSNAQAFQQHLLLSMPCMGAFMEVRFQKYKYLNSLLNILLAKVHICELPCLKNNSIEHKIFIFNWNWELVPCYASDIEMWFIQFLFMPDAD